MAVRAGATATPARRIAAEVLLRVERQSAFLNLALDAALRQAGVLEPREAALATELAYGAVRWQLELDRTLAAHADRPPADLDAEVRAALRLGCFELLHHPRVPARAAVSEAVQLTRDLGRERAAGLVNAVLRRVAEKRVAPPLPLRAADEAGFLAAQHSHPRWLVERWLSWLGVEETDALCAANQRIARASVRVSRRGSADDARAALARAGIESEPGRYAPGALLLAPGTPPALDLEGHDEGLFQAQDEAAQLVSLFAAPTAGARILDACAAPGGKACHLAELVGPQGSVLAIDLHARKARSISETAARLGLPWLEARAGDAAKPLPGVEPESFDLALVDAPCSGLGTLRRHPEVKQRRTPADIDRLATAQLAILANVQHAVKPGGLLVFSLCTLTPEECDEVPARFLAAHPQFRPEPPPSGWALPAAAECLDARGRLVTLPHRNGTDGFFAIRFRKER